MRRWKKTRLRLARRLTLESHPELSVDDRDEAKCESFDSGISSDSDEDDKDHPLFTNISKTEIAHVHKKETSWKFSERLSSFQKLTLTWRISLTNYGARRLGTFGEGFGK